MIDLTTCRQMVATYRCEWPVHCCVTSAQGVMLESSGWPTHWSVELWSAMFAQAIAESVRWGEPTVNYGPDECLFWAAPLMRNAQVLGGLVAGVTERELFPSGINVPAFDSRAACVRLRELLEEANLTNAALLEARRADSLREQHRAYALHAYKNETHESFRRIYLRHEPELLAAIRRGDRSSARVILNHILVIVFNKAHDRFDLIKSFFMELVATICRTAVEAGGATDYLLGENFNSLARLAEIRTLEELSPWLRDMFERVMDTIEHHPEASAALVITNAISYMREHLGHNLRRDEVAAMVHVSPSHFSKLFTQQVGQSFSQTLIQMRVDESARRLVQTDDRVNDIALDCGFTDQSYFTKMFRRLMHMTPSEYRRRYRTPAK